MMNPTQQRTLRLLGLCSILASTLSTASPLLAQDVVYEYEFSAQSGPNESLPNKRCQVKISTDDRKVHVIAADQGVDWAGQVPANRWMIVDKHIQFRIADGTVTIEARLLKEGYNRGWIEIDGVKYLAFLVDLDVDSDNTNNVYPYGPHDGDDAADALEDTIEDDETKPGKYICVNEDDDDHDGVPDYLDGYNFDGVDGNADDENQLEDDFVKMVFEISAPVDLNTAKIKVTKTGGPPDFRIWTKKGKIKRNINPISVPGGHHVPAGTYDPSDFGMSNDSPDSRIVKLWIEGLNRSVSIGDARILFEVDPGGFTPLRLTGADAVRLTFITVDIDVDSDNDNDDPDFGPDRDLTEDDMEDKKDAPGRIICVNNDDDDGDFVIDTSDGFNGDGIEGSGEGTPGHDDNANDQEDDFVRMVLEVPSPINLDAAKIQVAYTTTDLRIWTRAGDQERNIQPINDGGHFVSPTETYDASDFGLANANRTVNLWLEGRATTALDQRIVFKIDPDGDGDAGFVCADAVRVTFCKIDIVGTTDNRLDHVDIGHWGADVPVPNWGTGLTGYNNPPAPPGPPAPAPGPLPVNGGGGTFIDTDPDRFVMRVQYRPANTDPASPQTVQGRALIWTLQADGSTPDDEPDILWLQESTFNAGAGAWQAANNSSVFVSENLLLMSPDLPNVPAAQIDDNVTVHSVRTGGPVADDANNDRTHRVTLDGKVLVQFQTDVANQQGFCRITRPVCDRVPEERQTVTVRVHVFNEPYRDWGTDGVQAGGGVPPDADGTEGNGQYDLGEPYRDISGDGVRNTVLGTQAQANARVASELQRANIGWAQACIRVVQQGAISFEEAPIVGGISIFWDWAFQHVRGVVDDDDRVIAATVGEAVNVAEVFFVPTSPTAWGYCRCPRNQGAALPAGDRENTYIFVMSDSVLQDRVLAHELGHALINRGDNVSSQYIFFPSTNNRAAGALDNVVNQYRRITRTTEGRARTCRKGLAAGGALGDVGNRLLPVCP